MANLCGLSASETNRALLRAVAEDPACWSQTPVTVGTRTKELRITESGLTAEKETQVSNEIRADRMVPAIIETAAMSGGNIDSEFSAFSNDDFIAAFLLSSWSKPMLGLSLRGLVVSITGVSSIVLSGADYTAYFPVGRIVKTEGFGKAENNNYFTVSAIVFGSGNTTITTTQATMTAEAGSATTKIFDANDTLVLKSSAIRASATGFDSNGGNAFAALIGAGQLVVGQRIYVSGLGYRVADLTMTGQPADGDIITLVSGGKSIVFEFDSNSQFARGRTPITIGATEDDTATALVVAVNRAYAERKIDITASVNTAGAGAIVTFQDVSDDQISTVSELMANATLAAFAYVGAGAANQHGFFEILALTADTITTSPAPSVNTNAAAKLVTIKGSHVRNPGNISQIVKQSFTIETGFTDVNQYFVQRGMRVGSFSLSVATGEIITCGFEFMGKDTYTASSTVLGNTAIYVPLPAPSTEPMNATVNVGTLRKNGSTFAVTLQSIELEGDAGLREQMAVSSKFPAGIGYGRMSVSGTMNAYFETLEMFNHFLNHDTISLSFDLQDIDGNSYTFSIPAIKLTSDPIVPSGIDEDTIEEIEFISQRDPVLNTQFMVDRWSSVRVPTAIN